MFNYVCGLGYALPCGGQRVTSQHLITAITYDGAVDKALALLEQGQQLLYLEMRNDQ